MTTEQTLQPGNPELPEELQQARELVNRVRELYRDDRGSYAGRRDENQALIAEVAGDEARLIVDGALTLGAAAVPMGVYNAAKPLPVDYEDREYAGVKWSEFRSEFERLLVGFGVLTNRLHNKGEAIPSYLEMDDRKRHMIASVLFTDFLEHNALRTGAEGSGAMRSRRRYTEDGGVEYIVHDKDVASSEREIRQNIADRGYHSGVAMHAAGKISPADYRRLRNQYSEVPKDQFDMAASFYRDFEQYLAELGS